MVQSEAPVPRSSTRGTISAETGWGIGVSGTTVTNQGTLQAINGGGVSMNNFAPNAGVIRAAGGGTVAINGALVAGAGAVSIDIGGTAANQYGHLSVTGAATLSGTLNLAATGGFDPALGATFPFLTCGSRTGQWTTVNGNTGTGKQFTVTYGPTSATATVAAPAPPARITSTPIDSAQGVPVPGAGSIRPGDTLQLSTLVRDAEGARFRFPTAAGRKDRLEGTADLASGQWTVLLDHLEGGGEVLELLDTEAATLASYFSRILLLP